MIQPSFSFLVGVALPFSIASRTRRGDPVWLLTMHAAWRAIVLVVLGIFLRSVGQARTNFTFEDTLNQIGLGYLPLFLIAWRPTRTRWIALIAILVGTWLAFEAYPKFDGNFAAHFQKNTNLGWAFDRWFLNRFPRETEFKANGGGYSTLSFVPTLATMLLGLIAGEWLQSKGQGGRWRSVGLLMLSDGACVALGVIVEAAGLCPIVKRIWTPSWVLYSGGICFATLGVSYAVIDVLGFRSWTYPLRVIGRNSIVAYLMAHLIEDFVMSTFQTHLGSEVFASFGKAYKPILEGSALLAVYWLILWWMDRRRLYLKV